jgi:HAD superfamily hydrolase (TIGR01450 family)
MKDEPVIDRLKNVRHLALDMDGTIYSGGTLFDCTRPFLARLREIGIGYTFLTNNSSKSGRDYLARLKELDLGVRADQLMTSGQATIEYLRAHHADTNRLFILGTESLRTEFAESGFTVVGESAADQPDAIVVGFDTALQYQRLCMAGYWISRGKMFIATHPDRICPTDQQTLLVDCGALCACLENATGRAPDIVLGKPHPCMLDGILSRHHLEPRQLAMVGDRLYTDMAMARTAGAIGVLVLTGEATAGDVKKCPTPPDVVVDDLAELGRLLVGQRHLRAADK